MPGKSRYRAKNREPDVLQALTGWAGVNVPLLIVGLGALLIGTALPWMTAGLSRDRGLRAALALSGVLACVAALWSIERVHPPPVLPTDRQAAGVPGDGPVTPLGAAACVEALSVRMVELTSAAASRPTASAQAEADGAPAALPADAIGLVSGSATGTYHAVAGNLVELARQRGVPLFNRETQGSLENIRKLADPKENAALGFAQSDLLAWLRQSADPADRQAAATLRLVLPLYAEEVHVLARTGLRTLSDLSGQRVVTAASSQGSRHTAENLLRAAGIAPARLDSHFSAAEALCRVLTGRADAMVIVAGKPTVQLVSLDTLRQHPARPLAGVHLLPLEAPAPQAEGYEGYEPARIEAGDYAWLEQPVSTLAVRALLMAFDFSPRRTAYQQLRCRQLKRLGTLIAQDLPRLKQPPFHPKWREVDRQQPVRGWRLDTCSRT